MNVKDLRITKLRDYLFNIIKKITYVKNNINANALSRDINSYSLDKIPEESVEEKWINGIEIHKDTFSFRSRNQYSYDDVNNLSNIGFFEKFENLILENNRKGILPDIENIQSIECLNCGSMLDSETGTAEFEIQIRITYIIK